VACAAGHAVAEPTAMTNRLYSPAARHRYRFGHRRRFAAHRRIGRLLIALACEFLTL
jgi:hypothetical protein